MFSIAQGGFRRAPKECVIRGLFAFFVTVLGASAATLQQLSLDDLSAQATQVVCAKVTAARAIQQGSSIYTHYTVQVSQRWKGATQNSVEVVLPGGTAGGMRQSYAGVPVLNIGQEYVLFLWAGKSGTNHLLGLTQGLFELSQSSAGVPVASRHMSSELMLDAKGKVVQDQAVSMNLTDMSRRVAVVTHRMSK